MFAISRCNHIPHTPHIPQDLGLANSALREELRRMTVTETERQNQVRSLTHLPRARYYMPRAPYCMLHLPIICRISLLHAAYPS